MRVRFSGSRSNTVLACVRASRATAAAGLASIVCHAWSSVTMRKQNVPSPPRADQLALTAETREFARPRRPYLP